MSEQSGAAAGLSRRGVVTSVAVGATATGVVGCGSDEPAGDSTSSSAAGGSTSSSAAGGGGAGGPAAVTVPTAKVPVGGGFIDEASKVVVTQPTAGSYKAYTAVCTHEGCTVDRVSNNTIECPCHGSSFDATTGAVTGGPAEGPLAAKKVTVKGSSLEVT